MYIEKHPQIKLSMYIPLNCANVVTVYKENKATGIPLPTSLTELYSALACVILLRYMRAKDSSAKSIASFDDLRPPVDGKFSDLCKLAYDGIAGTSDQVKLIFTDLPLDFDGLGFTDSVFEFYVTKKEVASHNFLHLTFQEFLAAVHISLMQPAQRLEHFQRHSEGRLQVVLRFLAGLTKLEDLKFSSDLIKLLPDVSVRADMPVDHSISSQANWLYEAQRGDLLRGEFDNKTIEFSCKESFYCWSLGYCIANSQCRWALFLECNLEEEDVIRLVGEAKSKLGPSAEIVGLRGEWNDSECISVSLKGLNILFRQLWISRLQELALALPAQCNKIAWPDLSFLRVLCIEICDNGRNWRLDTLFKLLDPVMQSLTFSSYNSTGEGHCLSSDNCVSVVNFIKSATSLKSFSFRGNFVDDGDIEVIIEALAGNQSLEKLVLGGLSIIPDSAAEDLADFITITEHLQYLVLEGCMFFPHGALTIAEALSHKHDLKEQNLETLRIILYNACDMLALLRLRSEFPEMLDSFYETEFEDVDDDSIEDISDFLCDDPAILDLDFSGNCITDLGARYFSDILSHNSTLVVLDLSDNTIGDAGVEHLANALCSNTTLKTLALKKLSKLGDEGVKALADTLGDNSSLECLDLSGNEGISDEGVEALAKALHTNTTLKRLEMKATSFGDRGARALGYALCHNSSLECLDLSGNEGIGEEGVCHLVQGLTKNVSIVNEGTDESCGLVLDREKCGEYALMCPEYDTVKHKITLKAK
jgi:Ran GTPase-activating protein (RanGAP) involved in mRNA processing and transport